MKTPAPLRTRLFLNTLVILLLGMGLAALLSWRAVETLYLDTQRENLLAQASLTAAALQGQPLPALTQPYSQTSNIMPGIHTRLLSDQGVVIQLPLSEVAALPAENSAPISAQELLARPEITQAMLGQATTAIRTVASRRMLYAAAPVLDEAGTITGLVYLAMPLPAAGLPLNVILQLSAAALVAVTLALIAGTVLARRISLPIEAISQAAASVNLTRPVPTENGISELDNLGRAFNTMTESLRQSDQAKNAFIADVTHELRTPLTVIKGTIETLEDGALDDLAGRGPLLDSMQRETERLIRLVNDLLVLTRADAGTLNMEIEPLDLVELVRARCDHLSALAARREVHLVVKGAESAWVAGDVDRLSQVLDNLLDNAIRYSPEDSTITVEIHSSGSECQCAVSDCGPGIPEKHLPFIFDRFYRADASRNRQTGGAGLGLAIVRALVLAQGGQISAESGLGQGTTIRFTLPTSSSN
jgi:two-component system, OmpR family, sensor histidine kinase BaeS